MASAHHTPFHWIPGSGHDEAALARLRLAFPRPAKPMGEAWFMGTDRRMFPELLGDLDGIPVELLQKALVEIATGTSAFGPFEEWQEWFRYLLARLIPRSHETCVDALLEILITAFITQYPDGWDRDPYPTFRTDVLQTLGQCLMDPMCWPEGEFDAITCLNKRYVAFQDRWFWDEPGAKLSASLFFCLKYLDVEQIEAWIASLLAIPSPYWRAQIMVWLLGAHGVLSGRIAQPSELSRDDYPRIAWAWSHCLSGDYSGVDGGEDKLLEFIPAANRRAALQCVTSHFTETVFLDWLASIAAEPSLEAELGTTPDLFWNLYGAG
jgi:hypothetical protein